MHAGTKLLGTFRFVSDSVLVTLKHIEHTLTQRRRAPTPLPGVSGVSGEGECSLFTIEVVHMALILIDRDYTKQGYAQMAMPFTEPSMVAIPKAPSRKPRKASLKMMGWKSSWEKRTTGTPVIASVDT